MSHFQENRHLKEHYGGEEGINISHGTTLAYEYMSISFPPCEPIVIQRHTPLPIEAGRIGISVTFYELSHRTLGQGAVQGLIHVESATAANGTAFVHFSGSSVISFPPNVLTFN